MARAGGTCSIRGDTARPVLDGTWLWTPVSGQGVVHAFTIVHYHSTPAFRADTPYVVALIELDEGVRIMSNLVDVTPDPGQVHIGLPVEVVYDDVTPEMTLPKFRPAAE